MVIKEGRTVALNQKNRGITLCSQYDTPMRCTCVQMDTPTREGCGRSDSRDGTGRYGTVTKVVTKVVTGLRCAHSSPTSSEPMRDEPSLPTLPSSGDGVTVVTVDCSTSLLGIKTYQNVGAVGFVGAICRNESR